VGLRDYFLSLKIKTFQCWFFIRVNIYKGRISCEHSYKIFVFLCTLLTSYEDSGTNFRERDFCMGAYVHLTSEFLSVFLFDLVFLWWMS